MNGKNSKCGPKFSTKKNCLKVSRKKIEKMARKLHKTKKKNGGKIPTKMLGILKETNETEISTKKKQKIIEIKNGRKYALI